MTNKAPDQNEPKENTEHEEHKEHKPAPGPKRDKPARQVARVFFERRLAEYETRCQEYLDDLQRMKAEFENYRKRTERERVESANRASVNLIGRLIPVADDLDRAVEAAAQDAAAAKFADGLALVQAQFMKALADEGLIEIEAAGQPFDPHQHEAIMQEESTEHEDEHVIEVLRKGYRLGDTVIRPAMVKIARNNGA